MGRVTNTELQLHRHCAFIISKWNWISCLEPVVKEFRSRYHKKIHPKLEGGNMSTRLIGQRNPLPHQYIATLKTLFTWKKFKRHKQLRHVPFYGNHTELRQTPILAPNAHIMGKSQGHLYFALASSLLLLCQNSLTLRLPSGFKAAASLWSGLCTWIKVSLPFAELFMSSAAVWILYWIIFLSKYFISSPRLLVFDAFQKIKE